MPVPHLQFTVRGMLISVAVVGSLLSVARCLLCLEDSTYNAEGYSEDKFMSIRHGMQESDVVRILGAPLKVDEATEYVEVDLRTESPSGLGPCRTLHPSRPCQVG